MTAIVQYRATIYDSANICQLFKIPADVCSDLTADVKLKSSKAVDSLCLAKSCLLT